MNSYILIGMMGAGKSAIGRSVAALADRTYLDTDSILQNRIGRTITQMFRIYGEPAFRDHEAAVLRSLQPDQVVLATGGGIVQREDNWHEMRRIGVILYLRAPVDILIHRLESGRKKRPLLESEDWKETVAQLLVKRQPFYEEADASLDVGQKSIDEIAHEAYKIFLRLESESQH